MPKNFEVVFHLEIIKIDEHLTKERIWAMEYPYMKSLEPIYEKDSLFFFSVTECRKKWEKIGFIFCELEDENRFGDWCVYKDTIKGISEWSFSCSLSQHEKLEVWSIFKLFLNEEEFKKIFLN